MSWEAWAGAKNAKARAKGRWREIYDFDALGPRGRMPDGRPVVSFASNDYLGLSAHPKVMAAAHEAIERWGTGAGAARLISGSRPVHRELERALSDWKATEAALVFPTGFSANMGVLSALAGPQVLICSDALNHASIIDGCRLAGAQGARVEFYPHGDAGAVAALLRSVRAPGSGALRSIVVTDAVFSMDGDCAPVGELARACAEHDALLVLDEAHAVLGPPTDALATDGLACEVLRVGTLSKFLASQGGFVAGRRALVEVLVNRCRPFMFTTALAPASAAAAGAALAVLRSAEGADRLARLQGYAARLRPHHPPTPIVPVPMGTEEAALAAAASLLDRGLLVPAVRPPTVPPGRCRLRATLSAAHTEAEIGMLEEALRALEGLGSRWPV